MQQDGSSDLWDRNTAGMVQMGRRLSTMPQALTRLEYLLQAEPALRGRLVELVSAPIASGSLFFTGRWRDTSGAGGVSGSTEGTPVIVKLNCTPWDVFWVSALSVPGDPTALVPTVFASGEVLGGVSIRWLVLERLPHKLNEFPRKVKWDMLAEAAARVHAVASRVTLPDPPPYSPLLSRVDAAAVRRLVEGGVRVGAPDDARHVLERLDEGWNWLERTCPSAINWGDLHPGNALCRTPPPARGHAVLIDPIMRVGPWPFDAAYLQANVGADARLVIGRPSGESVWTFRLVHRKTWAGLQRCCSVG